MKQLASFPIFLALALGALLSSTAVEAQTIYRCGNEYTRIPCPNGRPLETGDTRSAAQRAEGRALLAQERRQAAEMQIDRRRNEAAVKPAAAGSVGPAAPASASAAASAPKKSTAKKKPKPQASIIDRGDFIAAVPGTKKKVASR